MEKWSVTDVSAWLRANNLSRYEGSFSEYDVDGMTLLMVRDEQDCQEPACREQTENDTREEGQADGTRARVGRRVFAQRVLPRRVVLMCGHDHIIHARERVLDANTAHVEAADQRLRGLIPLYQVHTRSLENLNTLSKASERNANTELEGEARLLWSAVPG